MSAVLDQNEPPVCVVPDKKYPGMYRLEWEDGSQSIRYTDPDAPPMEDGGPHIYGLYNLTRAHDILRNWKEYQLNYGLRCSNSFTDALK